MSYSLSAPPRQRFGPGRRKAQEWDGRFSDQITLATNLRPSEEGRRKAGEENERKKLCESVFSKERRNSHITVIAARVWHHRLSAFKDALAVMVASELISCLPSFVPHFSRRDESLIRPRG